jgi:hypothetical protein
MGEIGSIAHAVTGTKRIDLRRPTALDKDLDDRPAPFLRRSRHQNGAS